MYIADIGEFELIEIINNTIGEQAGLTLGTGDDACAWNTSSNEMLATTDSLVEGVHFEPGLVSWHDLGYKALAVNISDISAMAGVGAVALVSLALPDNIEVQDIISFYQGMLELSSKAGINIGGGNISRSPVVNITITLIGTVGPSGKILKRSGAHKEDLIAVTGYPGSSAAGRIILSGKHITSEKHAAPLTQAFLRPAPLIDTATVISRLGASSAIDISDGLLADMRHLLSASQAGAIINVDNLSLEPLLKAGFTYREALEMALAGGEDYELLFTASKSDMEKISTAIEYHLSIIGSVIEESPGTINLEGNLEPIKNLDLSGWRHFG